MGVRWHLSWPTATPVWCCRRHVELFFSMLYNAVLFITDADDPDTASSEVESLL